MSFGVSNPPLLRRFGLAVLALACVLGAVTSASASAERRVALVIGNAAYLHTDPLTNSTNDAASMARLFQRAGFTTVAARTNLGASALRRALADFELTARDADVAVVYYSGHGLELDGQNYLVPVDAELTRSVDIKDEAISLARVLEAISGATRLKLVILDACRTDPFKVASRTRFVTRGLARIEPNESNELIAYSAKAGTVAADGEPGGNSPYTAALLRNLMTPGLDVELSLRRARDDVLATTHGAQEPFYYGSVGGAEFPLVAKDGPLGNTAALEAPRVATPRYQAPPTPERTTRLETTPDPAIGECDRLAASPADALRPAGVAGVTKQAMILSRAIAACRSAHAADPDNIRITFELGRALDYLGTPTAKAEAFDLYKSAAEAHYLVSLANFGNMYLLGAGVARDDAEAFRWFQKGADSGDTGATSALAFMYEQGRSVKRDYGEAFRLYRSAAEAGLPRAMYELGVLYQGGRGVGRSNAEAMRWFRKAAAAGDDNAISYLATVRR